MSAQVESAHTLQDCITQGTELLEKGNRKEALEFFNKALTLDPKSAIAHSRKGQILSRIGNMVEARKLMAKGLELDPNHPDALLDKSFTSPYDEALKLIDQELQKNPNRAIAHAYKASVYLNMGKYEDALPCIERAIELSPLDPGYYTIQSEILRYQRKFDRAMEAAEKAISLDPTFGEGYHKKGCVYYEIGPKHKAIPCYQEGIKHNPELAFFYNSWANALSLSGRYEQCIELSDKAISLDPDYLRAYRSKGVVLRILGRWSEALETFDKAIALASNQAYLWCMRAEVLDRLERTDDAIASFKKANELINTDPSSTALLQPMFINWIKTTVKSAIELYDVSRETEVQMKKLATMNPSQNKFTDKLKSLVDKEKAVTAKLMNQVGASNAQEAQTLKNEIDSLKEEFQKQLELVKKEISDVQSEVKVLDKKVETLQNNFEDLRIEVNTKMDDFRKKLDLGLVKLDMNQQQTTALQEYFNAFIETFSSLYVTSQVIQSGQVELDAGSSVTSILSMAASFAPFFGDALSTAISGIGEFLKTKEMKTNAKKMLSLANSPSDLSQRIGGVVYDVIIENSKKRTQITEITFDDLEEKSDNLFRKIQQFCQKIDKNIDAYLYTELYKTAPSVLGHMDANKLVEYWMKSDMSPLTIKKKFITFLEEDLEAKGNLSSSAKTSNIQSPPTASRSSCCNMF